MDLIPRKRRWTVRLSSEHMVTHMAALLHSVLLRSVLLHSAVAMVHFLVRYLVPSHTMRPFLPLATMAGEDSSVLLATMALPLVVGLPTGFSPSSERRQEALLLHPLLLLVRRPLLVSDLQRESLDLQRESLEDGISSIRTH